MKSLYGWKWVKEYFPPEVRAKPGNIIKPLDMYLREPEKVGDITQCHNHPVCLITGDGRSLPDDVREFESWEIPHDLYCVNRSMLFFERQIQHWAAIDIEESVWFAENVNDKIEPEKRILRHTLGEKTFAYDIYWQMDESYDQIQRTLLVGSTGYFAVLTALNMGYEKIVIAGIPLDFGSHWYDNEDADGIQWGGYTYANWMDFKMKHPKADMVRSMGGYSAFIIGEATKEWANGSSNGNSK